MPRRLPIRIRDDADEIVRARCLRFLRTMLRGVSFTHLIGNNYATRLSFDLDDLTTEALERLALDEVGRFWSERRSFRRSCESYAKARAA